MLSRHDCSFGLVDGRPVFADLADDRYFMLEATEEQRFLASLRRADAEMTSTPVECPRPRATVLLHPSRRCASVADVITVWRLLLKVRKSLRRSPIGLVVQIDARGRRLTSASGSSVGPALASRFAQARLLVPIARNCLADSLALLRWLGAHGEGANLVFGVKLDPFAAHCWVQSDELLLNDHPDRVERFTPVRTVQCPAATR